MPCLGHAVRGNPWYVPSELAITPLPGGRGIHLAGDLDFSTAPLFTEALRAFVPEDELQLDLSEVILVDSAGLHALLGLARTRGNRSLVLLDPPAWIMRSFEIAGIDRHPAIEIRHTGVSSVREQEKRPPPLRRAG